MREYQCSSRPLWSRRNVSRLVGILLAVVADMSLTRSKWIALVTRQVYNYTIFLFELRQDASSTMVQQNPHHAVLVKGGISWILSGQDGGGGTRQDIPSCHLQVLQLWRTCLTTCFYHPESRSEFGERTPLWQPWDERTQDGRRLSKHGRSMKKRSASKRENRKKGMGKKNLFQNSTPKN